jgi:hypothetical protein
MYRTAGTLRTRRPTPSCNACAAAIPRPPHAVSCGTRVVGRQVRRLAAHRVATHRTPTAPHAVLAHLRLWAGWDLGSIRQVDALLRQWPATRRAGIERHPDVHWWRGEGREWWGLPVAERARTRFAARWLGLGHPSTLRKRGGLSLPATCEPVNLGAQLDDLTSPLTHQCQQLLTTQAGRSLGSIMGGTINPSCEGRKSYR